MNEFMSALPACLPFDFNIYIYYVSEKKPTEVGESWIMNGSDEFDIRALARLIMELQMNRQLVV